MPPPPPESRTASQHPSADDGGAAAPLPGARRRGRPRSEQAERAILDATLRLLDETRSVTALTIEAVAQQAGVGKATIYRRWPNKEALVIAAVEAAERPPPDVTGLPVREALVTLVEVMRRHALESRADGLLASILGEVKRHPELARRYHEVVVARRRDVMRGVLRRGVDSGELRDDVPVDLMMDLVSAPMLIRKLVLLDAELSPELPAQIVDAVLAGLASREEGNRR
jgi:AcrR family transcriptional regulator